MSTILTVTADDLINTAVNEGSVWVVTGTDADGSRIAFDAVWRPMRVLFDGALAEGEVPVEVEDWQVIATGTGARS
jgi:hypothetical protein